jgi:D-glycerate 3-kinase
MKGDDELSLRQLFDQIDYLVYLRPPSEVVAAWRQEQEDKLRAKLGQSDAVGLMDGRQIARFIQHYERLTRHMIDDLTERADALVDLDAERTPTLIRVRAAIGV